MAVKNQPIVLGSLRNTLGKLTARTAGKMLHILQANKINNITGKIRRSRNPTERQTETHIQIKYVFPFYSKYVDNYRLFLGTGVSQKWTTKSGRLSKIPTNYKEPLRLMKQAIMNETGKFTAEKVHEMIKEMKKEFVKIK